MKVCTLASGSSGNSLYVETEDAKILVDAGISLRQITNKLKTLDVEVSDLDAVVVSHEHSDHTSAITRMGVPVYVASPTFHLWEDRVSRLREFETGYPFSIKDVLVTPFSVPHDAIDPVGFTIETSRSRMGIVTDIGSVTALVKERLKGSDILIIESNHDIEILMYSPYPWELKQRIKGSLGHLSNQQSSELLGSLIHDKLRHVVLAHLSKVNNSPQVALRAASSIVQQKRANGIKISVAPRKSIGEVVEI